MFYISIKDKDNRKLDVLSCKSQSEIDKYTTLFKNEEDLLIKLGLNPLYYNVKVEKQLSKKEKREEIGFLGSYYRDIVEVGNSREMQIKFFDVASTLDRENLYNFFLNEYAFRYDVVDNDYDKERKIRLDKIIDLFHDEEEYQKKYGEDKIYFTNKKLSAAMLGYFVDQYNKLNYDNFKKLFRFMKLMKPDTNKRELTETEKLEANKIILSFSKTIKKNLSDDEKNFKDKITTEQSNIVYDDEPNFYGHVEDYDDIDKVMTELDMFLDEKKYDEEEKNRYIDNNKKRIFR